MRDYFKLIGLAGVFILVFIMTILTIRGCSSEVPTQAPAVPKYIPAPAEPDLGEEYLLKLTAICRADLSEVLRKVRVRYLKQVGEEMFPDPINRKWFYFVPCIENNFGHARKSEVGAVGFMQVMPKFAQEFANKCGLGKLGPKDLEDVQVNILVGACQFKYLMEYYKGDPTLALAAYNSGQDSPTVKKIQVGDVRSGSQETQGYLAAAFVIDTKMKDSKIP